jgi:DNA-binding Lrp family transcriptional regulator
MDPKDIRLLRLLEAVESNGGASQRALAEDLHISLGLVNASFRKLAAAGIFKATSNSRGHVKYELTRKGLHEKARLTYEHLLSSYRMYKDAIARLTGFFVNLEARNVRRLAFLGVSDFAEMAYLGMKETSIEMVAVVDESKKGQRFFGRTVESISVLGALSFDRLLVADPEAASRDDVRKVISETVREKVIFVPFHPSIAHDTWSSI